MTGWSRALRLGACLVALPLAAQEPHLVVGLSMADLRLVANDPGSHVVSDGTLVGGAARVRAGSGTLSATYREGQLQASGATGGVGYVEGSVALFAQLHPWFALGAGVTAHRVDGPTPERWVLWAVGARADVPILGDAVRGWAAFDQGIGGSVSLVGGRMRAQRGAVGFALASPRQPFRVDVGSALEHDDAGGGRSRTLQHFTLSFSWSGF